MMISEKKSFFFCALSFCAVGILIFFVLCIGIFPYLWLRRFERNVITTATSHCLRTIWNFNKIQVNLSDFLRKILNKLNKYGSCPCKCIGMQTFFFHFVYNCKKRIQVGKKTTKCIIVYMHMFACSFIHSTKLERPQ